MPALWRAERTADSKFPVRICIEQSGKALLIVRAREAWPGPGANVFCLRELIHDPSEALTSIETVPIIELKRIGQKITVILDRPTRKRCEFLILKRPYKDGSGEYEQIFFRTESALRAHKTRGRVELTKSTALSLVIDSAERYAWRFPAATMTRRKLPVGDYALTHNETIVALIERKTLDNFLGDFAELKALHQQCAELAAYPRAAIVIEAQYGDFLNETKIKKWPVSHTMRVLAELAALHPKLPLIFAGNRKLANIWAQQFFSAVNAADNQVQPDLLQQVVARYEAAPSSGGVEQSVRRAALVEMPAEFSVEMLRKRFPDVDGKRLRRVLQGLRKEGKLVLEGRGRAARWRRFG